MMFETRKILGDESIAINVTCARVPVRSCHSESVTLQTREPLEVEEARELLSRMPGLTMVEPYRPRSARPGATTSSSAASGATPRTSAGSASGSSRTTCSRAPQPTRSRSPRCCTSAIW